ANFRAMDCNHDGYLSYDEFTNRYRCDENSSTALPPAVEDEYSRLDRNRDGFLSQGEFAAGADAFRRYDRNNDGRVTRDEYASPLDPNSAEGRFQVEDLNNDGAIARGEWRGDRVTFDRLDRNNDGVVRWEEYANPPATGSVDATFDAIDRNNDRVITRGEWQVDRATF